MAGKLPQHHRGFKFECEQEEVFITDLAIAFPSIKCE